MKDPKELELFPREYELVYSEPKRAAKICNLEHLTLLNSNPESVSDYMGKLRREFREFDRYLFDKIVKFTWLYRRFTYKGYRRTKSHLNGFVVEGAYGVFMKMHVGYDTKNLTGGTGHFGKVASYLDDFFVNFDLSDPFNESLCYPYQHVTLEMLAMVYQMDERLAILKHVEETKMTLVEFRDFIINWVNCHNDKYGKKYLYMNPTMMLPYVKNLDRPVNSNGDFRAKTVRVGPLGKKRIK